MGDYVEVDFKLINEPYRFLVHDRWHWLLRIVCNHPPRTSCPPLYTALNLAYHAYWDMIVSADILSPLDTTRGWL